MTLLSKDDSAAAIPDFTKALKEAEGEVLNKLTKAKYHYWLARAYEAEGDLKRAMAELSQAKKLAPQMSKTYFWIGQVAFQTEDNSKAIDNYERSVSLDPGENPMAWYFLGIEYKEGSKDKKSNDAFKSFLRYWPSKEDDLAKEANGYLSER